MPAESPRTFEPVKLTAAEFDEVSALARKEFGLELGKGKEQLVAARVGKKMRELNLRTFREYREHIRGDRTGESLLALIDALTTNHTNFFREPAHFEFLRTRVFPEWQTGRGTRPRRIWCAASSTGEEPYSIALTAQECLGAHHADLPRILATDISTRVLKAASRAMYRAERFEGGPAPWLRKYLLRGERHGEGWFRMRPEIREMIEFRRVNLIEPLPGVGMFAVIFCRNVMIYFSRETQELVVSQLAACLEPGGYLLVGHAESLTGINHRLTPVMPAVYRKPEGAK
jgi:chemotaxis protein methyltransferase CheR